MKLNKLVTAISLCACMNVALADSVEDQMQAALKAYQAGDHQSAMNELKFAQAELQTIINDQSKKVMPDPLPGWTAEEVEVQNMGGMMMGIAGGTQLSRVYKKEGGKEKVNLQIVANSPMIQMVAMMMNNPMMLQSDPSMKVFRYGNKRGLMKHAANSNSWEASVTLEGNILLTIEGSNLESDKPVMDYLNAVDTKQVQQAFAP